MSERPTTVLGLFDTPDALMAAIHAVKAQKLGRLEAYTPYPIHGIEAALGLRRSPLGGMVLVMGILGALVALAGQYWISAVDYPIVTGGKAPWSWEAFIPIMFEVTVLFATFTAGLGMLLLLNKLPFFGHPVLRAKAMPQITRDRFALAIEAEAASFDVTAAQKALEAAGAKDLEVLQEPEPAPLNAAYLLRVGSGIVVAAAAAGAFMYGSIKLIHVLPPMVHMQDQPRMNAQQLSGFFKDGSGMRPPVAGTIARGHLEPALGTQDEAASLPNPQPRTEAVLARGRKGYQNHCAMCHGDVGDGKMSLTAAYGANPANLQSEQFRKMADGQIYWVISKGKNTMPSYAADLNPDERWAVVHYVRALQRAQNAKDSDLEKRGTR